MLFKHPWIESTEHMAICRNNTFWSTFKNSHCRHGEISCNGNIAPGFCTPNITWQEGKSMALCEKSCGLDNNLSDKIMRPVNSGVRKGKLYVREF